MYGRHSVLLVWIQMLCLCLITNKITCLVEYKQPVKLETCRTVKWVSFGQFNLPSQSCSWRARRWPAGVSLAAIGRTAEDRPGRTISRQPATGIRNSKPMLEPGSELVSQCCKKDQNTNTMLEPGSESESQCCNQDQISNSMKPGSVSNHNSSQIQSYDNR